MLHQGDFLGRQASSDKATDAELHRREASGGPRHFVDEWGGNFLQPAFDLLKTALLWAAQALFERMNERQDDF